MSRFALACGVILVVIGLGHALYLEHLIQHPTNPVVSVVGPQCTIQYPRGVKPERITKKKPVCTNGEFGATWRACTQQYKI